MRRGGGGAEATHVKEPRESFDRRGEDDDSPGEVCRFEEVVRTGVHPNDTDGRDDDGVQRWVKKTCRTRVIVLSADGM